MIIVDEYREYHILAERDWGSKAARAYNLFARRGAGGEAFRVGHVWRNRPQSWRWSDWDDNQRGARCHTRQEAIEQAAAWWYDVWIAAGERV